MSEWKSRTLGELLGEKGYIRGPFGSALKRGEMKEIGIPVYEQLHAIYNSREFRFFIDELKFKELERFQVKSSDLIISCSGTVGKISIINENDPKGIISQALLILRPEVNKVRPVYLKYFLTSDLGQYHLLSASHGSVQPNIAERKIVQQIPIDLPTVEEQDRIIEILSSLDDKIDLLQRQNKTLEEIAETLFRQWFVEGAEDSWEEVKLGEYVKLVSGYSYRSVDLNSSTKALVTLKNFDRTGGFRHDGFKEYTGKYKEDQVVVSGDLIVAHTDITQEAEVLGNPAIVISTNKYETLIISTDLVKVVPTSYLSKVYLNFLMKTDEFKHYCLGASNGTTVLHLSKKALPEYDFKLPPAELVERFTVMAEPLLEKKNINQKHIQQLETLRDTLLPKLMSGEVRVKN